MVQGYGHACDAMGIEVHQFTAVTGLEVTGRKVIRIRTTKGDLSAGAVLNATAGWATTISDMAGVPLPIVSQPLQACVTELIEPFLDYVIVSSNLHVYVSQTAKGELVIGSEVDPYQTYCTRSTLPTLEQMATYTLELFPQLHGLKILRQWAGVCDMTPDYAPIMGAAGELDNFFMDVGWGTWGFKAGPIAGKCLAETIATGKAAVLMEPFAPARFSSGKLLGEKAAASVSQIEKPVHEQSTEQLSKDLKALVKEKGIEYFLCSFVEMSGIPKAKLVPASALDDMVSEGAGFAGFAAGDVGQGPHDPDLVSIPDMQAMIVLPWRKNIAWVPGMLQVENQPSKYCPRRILARQLEIGRQRGYELMVGAEPEFMLLKRGQDGACVPWDAMDNAAKPCYDMRALHRNLDLLTRLIGYMQELGWEPYAADHEDANCQFEINWKYADALTTCDRQIFLQMDGQDSRRGAGAAWRPSCPSHLPTLLAMVRIAI